MGKKKVSNSPLGQGGGGIELSSLPIIDSTETRNSSNSKLTFRITTSDVSLDQLWSAIVKYFPKERLILAIEKEGEPGQHFHGLLEFITQEFLSMKLIAIRRIFFRLFEEIKLKKTTRQSPYALSWDRGKAAVYTVKMGQYKYQGYTEKEITDFVIQSYKKYEGHAFKDDLDKLVKKYLTTPDNHSKNYYEIFEDKNYVCYDIKQFIDDMIALKDSYGQRSNLKSVSDYASMLERKKHPERRAYYVNRCYEMMYPPNT